MIYLSMIYCSRCQAVGEPLVRHCRTVNSCKTKTTQYFWCRKCNRERQKKYYHEKPKKIYNLLRKSIRRQPEKQRARTALNLAVKEGKVKKPSECSNCGRDDVRICGHHHDYTKPLDVTWMCDGCHADLHRLDREES